jgi:hypothetical protein
MNTDVCSVYGCDEKPSGTVRGRWFCLRHVCEELQRWMRSR